MNNLLEVSYQTIDCNNNNNATTTIWTTYLKYFIKPSIATITTMQQQQYEQLTWSILSNHRLQLFNSVPLPCSIWFNEVVKCRSSPIIGSFDGLPWGLSRQSTNTDCIILSKLALLTDSGNTLWSDRSVDIYTITYLFTL